MPDQTTSNEFYVRNQGRLVAPSSIVKEWGMFVLELIHDHLPSNVLCKSSLKTAWSELSSNAYQIQLFSNTILKSNETLNENTIEYLRTMLLQKIFHSHANKAVCNIKERVFGQKNAGNKILPLREVLKHHSIYKIQ